MKVNRLIEILSELPQDAQVIDSNGQRVTKVAHSELTRPAIGFSSRETKEVLITFHTE